MHSSGTCHRRFGLLLIHLFLLTKRLVRQTDSHFGLEKLLPKWRNTGSNLSTYPRYAATRLGQCEILPEFLRLVKANILEAFYWQCPDGQFQVDSLYHESYSPAKPSGARIGR